MKLTGVIITYNEERNIERCLSSLKKVCDEIIVLDSFSSDQTEAICQKHGVRFVQHAFDGHIQQKNRAMQLAESDWVLSLDADEALTEELSESILNVKRNPSGEYVGSLIEQKELMLEKDAEVLIDYLDKHRGTMAFTDKSDAQAIFETFHMSKSAFKRALGNLFKAGLVELNETNTKKIEK